MPSDKLASQLEDPSISQEDHLEIDKHDLQKGKDEAIEVSYSVITTDQLGKQNSDDLLQKIGTMVNVQLAEEGSENLPFIPFLDFEKARASDKLFLYGPSGCGKSRAMFELVRENLAKFKKIYFINPRNTIGAESGRIKLLDLLEKLEEDNGVVWDNFPDDLVKRDLDTAKHVLDLVSSRNVRRLFIALKPRYLEIYKDLPREIPDFNSCEVSFDKDRLRKIILAYGTAITEFKDPFQKYIAEHADKISRILWQKEPTPLTILGYYKLLKGRIEEQKMRPDFAIDSVIESERLLRRTDYYEQQFEVVCRVQERRNDTEFLYTLKLCYECGLDRTVSSVEGLQFDIFGSVTPPDVLPRLSTWIYVSGQYYAMHDAQRESINFNDHVKLKIMDYLTSNFMKIVPNEDSQINTFGLFLGRNIQYIHKENLHQFLGPEIREYMKKKRYFQTALGQGVGESFLALDDELQEEMMKRMAVDIEFARGAVLGIGERFPILDRIRQREILEEKSKRFACVPLFAESIGINFKAMTDDLRKELFETAEKNPQFADGFGRGLGSNIKFFEQALQEEIFERAMKNSEFTRGFGYSHAFHFITGDKNEQKRIFEIADKNSHFSIGLGMGFAYLFGHLSNETLQQVFERTATDNEFAFGLGLYLGFNFHPLSPELQNWQFKTIEENGRFAYGLGYGYGITFPYYPQEIQSSLFERAEKNVDFAYGLGSGLGYSFGSLDEKLRESIFTKIKNNPELAGGLAGGLAFVSVLLPPKVWTDILARTEKNPRFAKGLGHGFGWILRFLPSQVRDDLFEKSEKNPQLAIGLGYGIGFVFPYVPEDLQSEVMNKAETMPHLVYGLGIGIAILSRYHESQLRDGIFNRLNLNIYFNNGLGEGTGYIFKYLSREQQNAVFDRIEQDIFFAQGFGTGIGQKIGYLSQKARTEIFEKMRTNPHLAEGLSRGIGMAFQYIPVGIHDTILKKASAQVRIARGLGEGTGSVIQFMPKDLLEERIFEEMKRDPSYANGIAQGMGQIFQYLEGDLKNRIFSESDKADQIAIGLGMGIASIFSYLDENSQKEIMKFSEQNSQLAEGLGTGIGLSFSSLSDELREAVYHKVELDYPFAKGLGRGLGTVLLSVSEDLQNRALDLAERNSSIATGIGYGLAEAFSLSSDFGTSSILLNKAIQISEVCKGFGFALAHSFPELTSHKQVLILDQLLPHKPLLAKSASHGLGHVFSLLTTDRQGQLMQLAESEDETFGRGLGYGLGYSFKNLDEVIQNELFALALKNKDSQFALGLGFGVGRAFPSLSEKVQKGILEKLSGDNCRLDYGFSLGLSQSQKYLDKDMRDYITNFVTINPLVYKQTADQLDSSTTAGFLIDGYEDFPLPRYLNERSYELQSWAARRNDDQEVSFSGLRQDCCVCFIDMMNSTKIASNLAGVELDKYYSIFLNAMATIVRNFDGKIIKNAGDALIYYFPNTAHSSNVSAFKDVLECGITMIAAHRAINSKMQTERLPPLDYRISADYGMVAVAKSKSSQTDDLFGSAMNVCAKINSKAPANGMVIGEDLYQLVKSIEDFRFERVKEGSDNKYSQYPAYIVQTKEKRNILNPFKRVSESKKEE